MPSKKVTYYYDDKFGSFLFSFGHPMKPFRVNMTYELIKSYGLDHWLNIKNGKNISLAEIENYHKTDFTGQLFFNDSLHEKYNIEKIFPKNTGGDCPIFSGLTEFVNSYTKASLSAAMELNRTRTQIAVNWSGGFHHAKYSESSGFCYINDIIISILEILKIFKKVLYVDIDAHHGDGVEEAFYLSKRVLCLSFHNYQKFFFPETGCKKNTGLRGGKLYSVNFPLKPGLRNRAFESILQPILDQIFIDFSPDIIVFQSGADSLAKDPLGKFNISLSGHGKCIEILKNTNLPILILGGGGYKISNVSRCWAYETSILLNKELSDKIPYNIYWSRYGNSFKLNFKISRNLDRNSKKSLLDLRRLIIKNVKKLKKCK